MCVFVKCSRKLMKSIEREPLCFWVVTKHYAKTHKIRKLVQKGGVTNWNAFKKACVSFVLCWRGQDKEQGCRKQCDILWTGSDFLSVLVPLQLNCGVSQINHHADLSTFICLICWIQFLSKSFEKMTQRSQKDTTRYKSHLDQADSQKRSTSKMWKTLIYLQFSSPLLWSSSSFSADPSDL